jgi:methylated-DNA-protein-cysteine methyltransferase-like protein
MRVGSTVLDSPQLRHGSHAATDMASKCNDIDTRIWQVVKLIPPGKVATYGDVARYAGLPGAARRVGRALRGLPEDTALPWHRVINAQGVLVVPGGNAARDIQREKLENEGITFKSCSRLNLRQYRWQPG